MNKLIVLVLAFFALRCESNSRSGQRDTEAGVQQPFPADASEPDTAWIHSDTTTSGGMNRQNPYDTLR